VPIDFWASRRTAQRLQAARRKPLAAVLDDWDVDLRYVPGPRYVGPPLKTWPDGSATDLWGVRRTPVETGSESYSEVIEFPLAGATRVEQIEAYPHWPSPDWFDYSVIEAQCETIRQQRRAVCFMGDRLNRIAQLKPAMYLRGVEQILIDLATRPEIAAALFRRIRGFYLEYQRRTLAAAAGKLDILVTGDDFGTQHGPLVSPAMWCEHLGDGFRQFISLAHEFGVKVMHHTCGGVRPIIPLMIERGLDVLQSIQPEAAGMEPARLKAAFGARLCFHGGISIQKTLPFGIPGEIEAEVRDRVAALARGGGFIVCTAHNIQGDTPLENIEALIAAYHRHGRRT